MQSLDHGVRLRHDAKKRLLDREAILNMWRVLVLLAVIMTACGRAEIDVQVVDSSEATALYVQQATQNPNSQALLLYKHEHLGLYFHYPAAWQVQENDDRITISNDSVRLLIEFGNFIPGYEVMPTLTVEATENKLAESTPVRLLGNWQPTYVNDDTHHLHYTSPKPPIPNHALSYAPFIVANFAFSIWLETDQWPLASEVRRTADAIVESLGFDWLVTRPPDEQIANWKFYSDDVYKLQFRYPPNWQVTRNLSAIVVTNDESAQLSIALSSGPNGVAAGELRRGDPSHVWIRNMAVARTYLLYNERIKAVYYGGIREGSIAFENYAPSMTLTGPEDVPYEEVDFSPELLQQIDWILTTLDEPAP